MDTAQWPHDQGILVKPNIIEEIIVTNSWGSKPSGVSNLEKKIIRPQKEQALNCPRCNSSNTKFCYYNNYSLTQPRYFCKTCKRYWTEGGSLRNIPIGGGASRKNKRPNSNSNSNSNSTHLSQNPRTIPSQNLNLSFPPPSHRHFSEIVVGRNPTMASASAASASPPHHLSAMELLAGMSSNSRGLNYFIPMSPVVPDPSSVYTTGFPDHLHDQSKSSLGFSLDGYGVVPTEANGGGRLVQLPFEDLKQGKEQGDSTGYWTGMLGGGSW